MGRKRFAPVGFLPPLPGLWSLDDQTHGFTVGYYLPRLRHWGDGARGARTRLGDDGNLMPEDGGVLSADFADDADEEKICAIGVICGFPIPHLNGSFPVFILRWMNGVEPDLQGWLVLAFVGTERMAWAGVDR